MNRQLHIICFTVPYPPAYGGVFDLYHKIVALHDAGVHIHLHCFTTGNESDELSRYCKTIQYYKRKTGVAGLSFTYPYIVSSRVNKLLAERLALDDHPILAEGVHSTGFLLIKNFSHRRIAVRIHNTEYIYYDGLYSASRDIVKKAYYKLEARLLRSYEKWLSKQSARFFMVSASDIETYRTFNSAAECEMLPVFTGFQASLQEGSGCYCLYHGNLGIPENERAAEWLVTKVFANTDIPLIIAGQKPSRTLRRMMQQHSNTSLISNPADDVLNDLLQKAQCHVLPSWNFTGVKLKIVHALFAGRHCISNTAGVAGSGLEKLCVIADSHIDFTAAVRAMYREPFDAKMVQKRKQDLGAIFNATEQVQRIIRWLS